jgi:lipopolysaccharide export system permease protein
MKILDWYILRKFLTTYIFTVLILISVLIVIDLTEKIENFSRPDLTVWRIMVEYYLNFIPFYANLLSPLMIFIAAVFVTAKLATHTEIIAILSSGTSLRRIFVPYLIGSSLIAVVVFYMVGWVIPNANKIRLNFEDNYVRKRYYFSERNVHLQVAPKVYAYLESYDNITNTGYRFTLEKIEGLELQSKLEAPSIRWDSTKRKWNLPQYKMRVLEAGKEKITYGQQIDTTLALKPKDFESKHEYYRRLTLTELDAYIAELKLRGSEGVETYLVEKYERYAYPICIVILTIIGVIVSARKTRGGTGFQIAFGFILAFMYIFLVFVSRGFAEKGGIPAYLAAWIPNALFCVIGILMYRRVPK